MTIERACQIICNFKLIALAIAGTDGEGRTTQEPDATPATEVETKQDSNNSSGDSGVAPADDQDVDKAKDSTPPLTAAEPLEQGSLEPEEQQSAESRQEAPSTGTGNRYTIDSPPLFMPILLFLIHSCLLEYAYCLDSSHVPVASAIYKPFRDVSVLVKIAIDG